MFSDPTIITKQVAAVYQIYPTVLNRIKWSSIEQINTNKTRSIIKIYGRKRKELIKTIRIFIKNNVTSITAKEIAWWWNNELNSEYFVDFIRNFIKRNWSLSYQKVKARPTSIDLPKVSLCRRLFAINFAKEITTKTLIINIDESVINRNVKALYSWGYKGTPIKV